MRRLEKIYNQKFYKTIQTGSSDSAAIIVPLLMEYVRPSSVIDVGCGTGDWLYEFLKFGVDIVGIDGAYLPVNTLKIPKEKILLKDLNEPLSINRRFDLVVSLEVAEHLYPERAESFVSDLTHLAPIILFSAAVPGQGGHNHVNEQWPSYWARLFNKHDYIVVDILRSLLWDNGKIQWWYRQNLLIFIHGLFIDNYPLLKVGLRKKNGFIDLIHPENYLRFSGSVRTLVKNFFKKK